MEDKEIVINEEINNEEGEKPEEESVIEKGVSDEIIEVSDETTFEKVTGDYTSKNLKVLEGLEAVRIRPGMYIGSTSSTGLHHLVWEIVDNGIDEALAGYCNEINVIINEDNTITVKDNGRGIPTDIVEATGVSGVETVYTKLHAGGKFGNGGYKVSGGLHGVGASVVNALSTWVEVTVRKNGNIYFIRFENGGHPVDRLKVIGTCDLNDTGTTVTFKPDPLIFTETVIFNYETISNRLRQMAFLNKGIKITLTDKRIDPVKNEVFKYDGGIKEYVSFINKNDKLDDTIIYCDGAQKFTLNDVEEEVYVEVAMQYTTQYNKKILSFCNNVSTGNGGTHEEGFGLALTRVINAYAKQMKFLKDNDKDKIVLNDCLEGLTAVISVKHPNPEYEGQTKGKLGNSEVKKIVSNVVGEKLERFLYENKVEATKILDKIRGAYNSRLAANAARENSRRKGGLDITTLPGKLADCVSNNPEECELFIVEGNSAGGSAKLGRDAKTQAILPLRGKILNVQKAQSHRIFENAEIGNMINAIGAGFNDDFDITKARYHKIVIMTDADVDGSHIRILLLTFFNRFMRPLIEHGYVYIAQPPLYQITFKGKKYYAYSDNQLEILKKTLDLKPGYPYSRFKGLGEMDPEQLEETTMDPKGRSMLRVTIDDAAAADLIFNDLMGEEVEPRSEFIKNNAKFVKNLDI